MKLLSADQFTIEQLTKAYNQTRVDYLVPMPMSVVRLQEYIDTYDIDLSASVVVLDGNDVLGLAMLGVREKRSWITRLGVLPTSRRHGAGRVMMEYLIHKSRLRGLDVVYLEVIDGNVPAHALFRKLGFVETQGLLILRRPPGPPPGLPPPDAKCVWLSEEEVLDIMVGHAKRPAWTNQVESLRNAGRMAGLHLTEAESHAEGWLTYQRTALQLKRVILDTTSGSTAPAYGLLYQLHTRFPTLDTVVENIAADDPHLPDFLVHGYVESFRRIEMELRVK